MSDQLVLPSYASIVAPPAYTPQEQRQQQQQQQQRTALASSLVHLKRKQTSAISTKAAAMVNGPMGSRKKDALELTMTLSDNLLFVYPNEGQRVDPTSQDSAGGEDESTSQLAKKAYLVVSLTLNVPAACTAFSSTGGVGRIRQLTVELQARESLGFPDAPFEYNKLELATKTVEEATASVIEPGQTYRFHTVLEVPHSVALYECNRFGRLLPCVQAKLQWDTTTSTSTEAATSKSTWKRLASLSGVVDRLKTLKAEQDVWIMAIPRASHMLDYARTHQSFVDSLGPIVLHTRTQHLTVGGYLRLGVCLPAPAPGCVVERITMALLQNTKLRSRQSHRGAPPHTYESEPERIPFFTVQGEDLKRYLSASQDSSSQTGQQVLRGDWVARLPTDRYARPSTLQGSTDSSLRICHQLEVRIFFKPAPSPDAPADTPVHNTVYSAAWPLTLSSCACRWRSLKLPTYSERDPCPSLTAVPSAGSDDVEAAVADVTHALRRGSSSHSTARQSHNQPYDQSNCTCGTALDELLRYEREQDAAQQASTVALMRQEIELASSSSTSPSSSSSCNASVRSRVSLDQRGIAARGRQGSLVALQPVRSIDVVDYDANTAATGTEGGPGGIGAWADTEENERRRRLIEQKAEQEYRRDSTSAD